MTTEQYNHIVKTNTIEALIKRMNAHQYLLDLALKTRIFILSDDENRQNISHVWNLLSQAVNLQLENRPQILLAFKQIDLMEPPHEIDQRINTLFDNQSTLIIDFIILFFEL